MDNNRSSGRPSMRVDEGDEKPPAKENNSQNQADALDQKQAPREDGQIEVDTPKQIDSSRIVSGEVTSDDAAVDRVRAEKIDKRAVARRKRLQHRSNQQMDDVAADVNAGGVSTNANGDLSSDKAGKGSEKRAAARRLALQERRQHQGGTNLDDVARNENNDNKDIDINGDDKADGANIDIHDCENCSDDNMVEKKRRGRRHDRQQRIQDRRQQENSSNKDVHDGPRARIGNVDPPDEGNVKVGAVRVPGIRSGGPTSGHNDNYDYDDDDDFEWQTTADDVPVADPSSNLPPVLDGHLATEDDDDNKSIVFEGVREVSPEEQLARDRRKLVMIGVGVVILAVIISVTGVLLFMRSTSSSKSIDPTPAPTSDADRNDAVRLRKDMETSCPNACACTAYTGNMCCKHVAVCIYVLPLLSQAAKLFEPIMSFELLVELFESEAFEQKVQIREKANQK